VLTAPPLTSRQGMSWVMGEMCCSLYNHVAPPNQTSCAGNPFPGTMANMAMQVPPSSNHPGGVNVLMGDASGRFIKSTVDVRTWRNVGTRNGGEVISADGY
jgi:prepilin-type processing-associated H-X9-DG protein